ncbi:protein of unknown function DUF397 [Actinobacteria bacterium OK074]|nr:protein of unknown function DUF397 [Actinobacteria bacterium OK074]
MSTHEFETATWRSSSYSGQTGDCVEVADGFPSVLPIRDSKTPEGPRLAFKSPAWSSFVTAVKAGALPSV